MAPFREVASDSPLQREHVGCVLKLSLNRPADNNSINRALLVELNRALDMAEQDARCKVVVLSAVGGAFCTGMDFKEASANAMSGDDNTDRAAAALFMGTMKRLSLMPKVVIAAVDGLAAAGGVGLVAAADLVVASPRARFSLPEALWGLLPCCVTPFLVRRVGFQTAYRLTLTTQPISAERAKEVNLVDELGANVEAVVEQLLPRLTRLQTETIGDVKRYFRSMWLVTDAMEEVAIDEIARLTRSARVRQNIRRFVEEQQFPWDPAAADEHVQEGAGAQ